MKVFNISASLFLLLFILSFNGNAQEDSLSIKSVNQDSIDILKIQLLPLEQLIDSAQKYSPGINASILLTEQRQIQIKQAANTWLKGININSSYNWGTNNATIDGTLGVVYNNRANHMYVIGASASLPIHSFVDRKNQIRIREIDYKISQDELKERKIRPYSGFHTIYVYIVSASCNAKTVNSSTLLH